MRITGIELGNWMNHRHLALDLAPMTIICGPNGAGKTAIRDAICFGMAQDLPRGVLAGDRKALVSEGAAAGRVTVRMGEPGQERAVHRDIATSKAPAVEGGFPMREGAVVQAARGTMDPARFSRLDAEARRVLLMQTMQVPMTAESILAKLKERGHPAELLAELKPELDLDAWRKRAADLASEARGAWKQITGANYGSKVGEEWKAEVPELPEDAPTADAMDTARQAVEEARTALAEHDAAVKLAGGSADTTALRQKAELHDAARDQLAWARKDRGALFDATTGAEAALKALEAKAPTPALYCPHCGSACSLTGSADGSHSILVEHEVAPGQEEVPEEELAAARQAVKDAEAAFQANEDLIERSEATMKAAAAAKEALAAISGAYAPATDRTQLAAALDAAQTVLREVMARHQAAEAAVKGRHSAAQRTKDAAAKHQRVKDALALAEALAPGGIPGELLAKALKPFNDTLAAQAAAVKWPAPSIGDDMAVRVAGRPYQLRSRSEQWRTDALIAVALAIHSKVAFLLLDEFDLLEVPARRGFFGWIFGLVKAGHLDTALLFGTLKAPPQVPGAVAVHWLGEPLEQKAAA